MPLIDIISKKVTKMDNRLELMSLVYLYSWIKAPEAVFQLLQHCRVSQTRKRLPVKTNVLSLNSAIASTLLLFTERIPCT